MRQFRGNGCLQAILGEFQVNVYTETEFLDARNFDYRLSGRSKARGAGRNLKNSGFEKWIPEYSYHHKSGRMRRMKRSRPAAGAYEY